MIRKLLFFVAVATLATQPVNPQSRPASAKEVKAGEVVQLGGGLTVKVTQSTKPPFASVKVKGEPVVVVLELDAGKKGVTLSYKVGADSKSSDVYLASGAQKLAPSAVMEDFPSWGNDNDKEVEVLDPKETAGSSSIQFEGKGFISLLFDIPPTQSKSPKKLSIILRTVQPSNEQHSLVVNM